MENQEEEYQFSFDPETEKLGGGGTFTPKFPFAEGGILAGLHSFTREENQMKLEFVAENGAILPTWISSPKSDKQATFLKKQVAALGYIVSNGIVNQRPTDSWLDFVAMFLENFSPENKLYLKVFYQDDVVKMDAAKVKPDLTPEQIHEKYTPFVSISRNGRWFKSLTDTVTVFEYDTDREKNKEFTSYTVEIVQPDGSSVPVQSTPVIVSPPVIGEEPPKVLF